MHLKLYTGVSVCNVFYITVLPLIVICKIFKLILLMLTKEMFENSEGVILSVNFKTISLERKLKTKKLGRPISNLNTKASVVTSMFTSHF